MSVLYAPWSEKLIKTLNDFQNLKIIRPYTCKNNHILKATKLGWVCSKCDFKQDWCFNLRHDIIVEKHKELKLTIK